MGENLTRLIDELAERHELPLDAYERLVAGVTPDLAAYAAENDLVCRFKALGRDVFFQTNLAKGLKNYAVTQGFVAFSQSAPAQCDHAACKAAVRISRRYYKLFVCFCRLFPEIVFVRRGDLRHAHKALLEVAVVFFFDVRNQVRYLCGP